MVTDHLVVYSKFIELLFILTSPEICESMIFLLDKVHLFLYFVNILVTQIRTYELSITSLLLLKILLLFDYTACLWYFE